MAHILRGDIRWANLDPVRGREQAGQRPVLILSHDNFNEHSNTVIAVALTNQPQRSGFPLTLKLPMAGLPPVHQEMKMSESVIPDIFNRESSVFSFSFVREEKDAGFLLSQE